MIVLRLALQSLRNRWLTAVLTVFAIAVSIMLLLIIANAMLFAHVLNTERIPHHIASIIVELGL